VPLVHDARLPGTQDRDHAAGPCVGAGGRADIPADVRDPGRPRAATCTALPWPGFLVEESRAWVADLASPDRVWSLAYVAIASPRWPAVRSSRRCPSAADRAPRRHPGRGVACALRLTACTRLAPMPHSGRAGPAEDRGLAARRVPRGRASP
jgi:hypothetical protein